MYRIRKYKQLDGRIPFDDWFIALKDVRVKARLLKRLNKIQLGNLGDWNSLGDGVFELREHFNGGYRIYYGIQQKTVILLLCGGDKSTQSKDIKRAKAFWQENKQSD